MSVILEKHIELNSLQISLLRLFNKPMPENEVLELKRILVTHFSNSLDKEVTTIIEKKEYTQKNFDDFFKSDS